MSTSRKVVSLGKAVEIVSEWKTHGSQIVFSNGCFDLLHLGHIDYLEKAAQKGDKLVIAINSDDSVRGLKGASRPMKGQEERARLLAALQFVDLVLIFEDDTPIEPISAIVPNILVKGGDYEISNIVGADIVIENGGKVETIPFLAGFSTTSLVEKIIRDNS